MEYFFIFEIIAPINVIRVYNLPDASELIFSKVQLIIVTVASSASLN